MNRESLLDTVRRLIALGSSPNEHEARLATAKAAALMLEHNLAMADVNVEGAASGHDYCDEVACEYKRTVPADVKSVCSVLMEHFFVHCVTDRRGGDVKLKIFGDRSNVEVAKYVFTYLLRTFRRLAKENAIPTYGRPCYASGLARGFSDALKEQRDRDFGGVRCTALVASKKELTAAAQDFYDCKLRHGRRAIQRDTGHYSQGLEHGRSIDLRKGVAGNARLPAPRRAITA